MIVIVNYGLGNLRSISNMLQRLRIESRISSEPAVLRNADRLILPGVGHFKYGMERLRQNGLVDLLSERVLEAGVPLLGICLGAQLLGRGSDEGGASGLGWIPMDTVAFDRTRLAHGERVPHMAWTETKHSGLGLFEGLSDDARFYYVHSFHFQCEDPSIEISSAEYGYRFVSGVRWQNVIGVQFHPEKSHIYGKQLLANFATMKFS
jgi:glutamine amidotransferase